MHLVIGYASALAEGSRAALPGLGLVRLPRLLAALQSGERVGDDEYSLSPPHEHAWARAVGLAGGDGTLPLAALAAAADGVVPGGGAVGLMTPVHWHVGRDQVTLADPDALQIDEAESRAALEAIRPLFESEGYRLHWGAPTRWYAEHDDLAELRCAALDRVIGRPIDLWLPPDPRARRVRRLQNEVQMLLYTHPLNAAREARGALPINSFWLSGCGRPQPVQADGVTLDLGLRAAALREDWPAWSGAWRTLDAGPVASLADAVARGARAKLTLCGERHAQSFTTTTRGPLARLASRWRSVDPAPLLEAL